MDHESKGWIRDESDAGNKRVRASDKRSVQSLFSRISTTLKTRTLVYGEGLLDAFSDATTR